MITAISMSYRTAPIAVRERFSVDAERRAALLRDAARRYGGAALLGTCNRLELYVSGDCDEAELPALVAEATGVPARVVERAFRAYHGLDAVRHLFRVASGLESVVLGEAEVLGQVRTAFSEAVAAKAADRTITHAFHTAIRAGKRARTDTAISAHSLSVSSLAARAAAEELGGLSGRTALVVGAGEAGRLAATALRDQGVGCLVVANRTFDAAAVLAEALGGEAIALDSLRDSLPRADVVVTTAGAGHPLIKADEVHAAMRLREGVPMAFVDIGVPRDVDPAAATIPGVRLIDLDQIEELAAENAQRRRGEVGAVEAIVDEMVAGFATWAEQRTAVPTIRALTTWADEVRERQAQRALRGAGLSAEERTKLQPVLDAFSRSLVQQILHPAISAVREGPGERNAGALRELFGLDEEATD